MLTQHRDEELVLFQEMRHYKKESDHNNIIGTTTMSSQGYTYRRNAADNFLYSETEKSDYDWLVTPPGSPTKSLMNQLDTPDTNHMDLISMLGNCLEEENDNLSSKNRTIGLKRPSSSNSSRATSRPSTPTKRSMVPTSRAALSASSTSSLRSTSRPSTPTKRPFSSSGTSRSTSIAPRATLASSSTSSSRSTSRASTPTKRPSSSGTSRATSTATRVTESTHSSRSMSRPSTPTNRPPSSGTSRAASIVERLTSSTVSSRSMSRPSTPTSRPSTSGGTTRANLTTARATIGSATSSTRSNTRPMTAPSPKPGSRSSTPTRRPSTPTGSSTTSKSKATKPVDIPAPSPVLRSRPWEPYEMPGFSLEAPSNLRTTLPDRPQTASSRGTRPGSSASSSRSTSIEPIVSRKQSCSSPSRNQAPIINSEGGGSSMRGRRVKTGNEDSGSSHVVKGNQMAENTRKLAPPRLSENRGQGGGMKSSSRNLSKSSIDMALRHLGVKRGSMTGNLRPQVTKVSGTGSKRPMSSSGSSESNVNILCLDGSDDNLSDISYS